MSTKENTPSSFGTIIINVLITLIIMICAGLFFVSITKEQNQSDKSVQEKITELKTQIDGNSKLNDKITELENKIIELDKQKQQENLQTSNEQKINEIDTTNWNSKTNNFFKLSFLYPQNYNLCQNKNCETKLKDSQVDFWELTPQSNVADNSLNYSLTIYPRINALKKLAIEFGQDMFDLNRVENNVIQNSEALGIFKDQLSYQFDVSSKFLEAGVLLQKNQKLVLDEEAQATELLFSQPHRIIYFDYNGFIYRIIHPIKNETINKILETIKFI